MTASHACYDSDARTCWDLRYYGYSPVLRGQQALYAEGEEVYFVKNVDDDDECECSCHED
jgi:hypothetical protein